jgi:ankyrin repeat protein
MWECFLLRRLEVYTQPMAGYDHSDSGQTKVARLLMEHGVDVSALENDRHTALHMAVQAGKIEVVRVVLEHGADVGTETWDGKTAFRLAREKADTEIMKLSSEYGSS